MSLPNLISKPKPYLNPLSIAPMVDWTNTHFRVLMRMIAPRALVYTEMQTLGAIFNNPKRALTYDPIEHPLALQVGGADEKDLARAAQLAQEAQFDEINLNVGCPSSKVQAGRFGVCLMREKKHVSDCIRAMKQASNIPVTVKTRIGIDEEDSYAFFSDFAASLIEAGTDKLIIHARKAWLKGLNPKQNRTIPPLNYDYVYRLKQAYPDVPMILNGNVSALNDIQKHMEEVDGVMIGRLACEQPYTLSKIHTYFYPQVPCMNWEAVLQSYSDYVIQQAEQGVPLSILCKPLMNMAHGLPGSKRWKKKLMELIQHKESKRLLDLVDSYVNLIAEKQE